MTSCVLVKKKKKHDYLIQKFKLDRRKTHFGNIAVIKCMFDHQPLQHLDGDLTDLSGLLKSPAHFPKQQTHQEVVSAEVISERIIQL